MSDNDFYRIIQNLKNALPVPEEKDIMSVNCDSISAVSVKKSSFICMKPYHYEWIQYWVKHMMFSTELFFFFFVLLAIIRPEFLYIREKKKRDAS
jgi:hypothetical protein